MDIPEEIITPKEMLERIAELDYSQNQLRDLNAEMRRWLDVADDDMAALRLENADLRKQTKALEKIISEARQVETDPWGALLADDLDVKKCSEKNIQKLEEEVTMMKEQNKKLTAELKSLQQEREQGKISLSKCSTALQTLECGMKEAQSELQRRDEIIHQKDFLLKFSEEMIDEYTNIIKELRLKNQELTKQLEDRQDEATLSAVNGLMEQKEGSLTSPVSFAEEVRLLRSSIEMEPSMSDFTHLRHEETETEALLKAETLTMRLPTKRWAGILKTAIQKAGLFILCLFIFSVMAFMALGNIARHCDFFSINTFWTNVHLILQPYLNLHYSALPPI